MKAIILLAGMGTRLKPLTENNHKALLPIGDSTVLEHMVTKLNAHGINSFIIVTGHLRGKIAEFLLERFPELEFTFVPNEMYESTNTGYSLMLAMEHLGGEGFIKLDGDVIFEDEIIERLMAADDDASHVVVDNTAVDEEVIKVMVDESGHVTRIGNKLPVHQSVGESIGVERISATTAPHLYEALKTMVTDPANLQKYYEVAYDTIIVDGHKFKVVDITGLKWVEMDNHDDYAQAKAYFA
jgi:choline kinase